METNEKKDGKKKKEFIRFLIVGTLATLILYAIYYVLCKMMHPSLAYSIAYFFSFLANFFLTSYYTFKKKPTLKKGIGFAAQQGLNYLIQLGFLNLFLWLDIPKEYAPFPVFVIVLPINFILLKWIFKDKKNLS